MSLFQLGNFVLHSGDTSGWKVDCDALSDRDIEALAYIGNTLIPYPFGRIVSIPRGGDRFAAAMQHYVNPSSDRVLVVDDVLTTGESMKTVSRQYDLVTGLVIFARGPVPSWIIPIWRLGV